jgi:hypothetical protein
VRPFLPLLAVLWVGACASPAEKLPTCDGQHRRPANPYGSVLTDPPAKTAASAPADPASLHPCGGR